MKNRKTTTKEEQNKHKEQKRRKKGEQRRVEKSREEKGRDRERDRERKDGKNDPPKTYTTSEYGKPKDCIIGETELFHSYPTKFPESEPIIPEYGTKTEKDETLYQCTTCSQSFDKNYYYTYLKYRNY